MNTIIVRRLCGDDEFPVSALNDVRAYGKSGNLYLWQAFIVLDDERVKFEAEGFYHDMIPRIWHESDEDQFSQLAEPDVFKLLEADGDETTWPFY